MSQQFTAPPRKKNALDGAGFRLTAEKVPNGEKRPTLGFSIVKNKVRVDVYTNVPGDKKNGNIRAELTPELFFNFLTMFDDILENGKEDSKWAVETKGYVWNGNKRSDEMLPQARLVVGKNKHGLIYLAVLSFDEGRPRIMFPFDDPFGSALYKDGKPLELKEVSALRAKSFVAALYNLVPVVLGVAYEEPPVKEDGGNNNRGQQQQQQQRRPAESSGSSSMDEFDDDIPM